MVYLPTLGWCQRGQLIGIYGSPGRVWGIIYRYEVSLFETPWERTGTFFMYLHGPQATSSWTQLAPSVHLRTESPAVGGVRHAAVRWKPPALEPRSSAVCRSTAGVLKPPVWASQTFEGVPFGSSWSLYDSNSGEFLSQSTKCKSQRRCFFWLMTPTS